MPAFSSREIIHGFTHAWSQDKTMSVSERRSRSGVVGMGRSKVRVDSHVAIVGQCLGSGLPIQLFMTFLPLKMTAGSTPYAFGANGFNDRDPLVAPAFACSYAPRVSLELPMTFWARVKFSWRPVSSLL